MMTERTSGQSRCGSRAAGGRLHPDHVAVRAVGEELIEPRFGSGAASGRAMPMASKPRARARSLSAALMRPDRSEVEVGVGRAGGMPGQRLGQQRAERRARFHARVPVL